MIISNLIGGLGNQMFQFSIGRAVSLRNNTTLRLDISAYENYGLHQGFELNRIFCCKSEIANEENIRSILGWQYSSFFRHLVKRRSMKLFRKEKLVVEPHFHYWNGIEKISSDCYLQGYWQSEAYFKEVEGQLRKDFSFRLPLSDKNTDLSDQISRVNAVSLHVRRGDYVNNPQTAATHGLCTLKYYRDAIKYVASRVSQPHFYVFSDDLAWVKHNLKIEFPCEYVDCNHGEESYNDMRLMSMCKHHIIANSSFSWWGAWLNSSAEKIVVAPKNWFVISTNVDDLLPPGWIKL